MERKNENGPATSFAGRYFNAHRIASYVLVLFALGHTFGAVIETPATGEQGDAVAASMKSVAFQTDGATCTWYGWYRGFGIYVTLFFLASAVITWWMGGMKPEERARLAPLTWTLFVAYAASIVIDVAYFFTTPTIFSCVIAAVLGFAAVRARSRATATASVVYST